MPKMQNFDILWVIFEYILLRIFVKKDFFVNFANMGDCIDNPPADTQINWIYADNKKDI